MIKTKEELIYFLKCDQKANFLSTSRIMHHFPACYATLKATYWMRLSEYYYGVGKKILGKICEKKMERICTKLGMILSVGVFGPGLRIAHPFGVIVAKKARIGTNCFLHQGVTIGLNENEEGAPVIGDNFVAGAGAKIIGSVTIANNVCVGANAVVVKDISNANTTWGGVPAKQISSNSSVRYLNPLLFEYPNEDRRKENVNQ